MQMLGETTYYTNSTERIKSLSNKTQTVGISLNFIQHIHTYKVLTLC